MEATSTHNIHVARSAVNFFTVASAIFYFLALAAVIGGGVTLAHAAPGEDVNIPIPTDFGIRYIRVEDTWDSVGVGAGIAFIVSALVWIAFALLASGLIQKVCAQHPTLAGEYAKKRNLSEKKDTKTL